MTRGFYIASTGMMLQRRNMENVTNNITNVETSGYKKDFLVSHSFDDVLLRRINDTDTQGQRKYVGPLNFGTVVNTIHTDHTQGTLEETGISTDLALVGDAFFALQTPGGERYSKNSSFIVDGAGYLVDPRGNYLMGQNGRIQVGSSNFTVTDNGNVYVGDRLIDSLRIVSFDDSTLLENIGFNLYELTGGQPANATQFAVKQGFLEGSNVDISSEMVSMITVFRAYETNQKILTMIDEITGKAVNEIGAMR